MRVIVGSDDSEVAGWRGDSAYVRHGAKDVRVGVVKGDPPYLRTYADQTWNDNLLALPRY